MRGPLQIAGVILSLSFGMLSLRALAQDSGQQQASDKQNGQSTTGTSPQKPAADKEKSTAQDNPFPEDVSKKAAEEANPAPHSDAPATADTPKNDGNDAKDTETSSDNEAARKKLKLEAPEGGTGEYNPKLAADDDRIGNFYMQISDYRGAYNRFKEASAVDPGDAQAVWGLAESARKLNLKQEAIENYQAYLDAVPDGAKAKQARKALSELGASAKSH